MNNEEQESTPSFELPQTHGPEQVNKAQSEQLQTERTETQSSVAVEQGISKPAPPPQAPPQKTPPTTDDNQQASQPPADDSPGQHTSLLSGWMPQIADDTDLIEKEWVIKAKEIVAHTAHDPHLQNREINKFKAEYLKKRYNKEIKLSEDS